MKLFAVKIFKSMWFTRLKESVKEMTGEFLPPLDLLFDIAHDQETSLISNDACRTKSTISQDLKLLEDSALTEKWNWVTWVRRKYCMKFIRKACRQIKKITKGRTRAVSTDEQTNHKINGAVCLVTSHTVSTMASMINISSAQSRQLHSWRLFCQKAVLNLMVSLCLLKSTRTAWIKIRQSVSDDMDSLNCLRHRTVCLIAYACGIHVCVWLIANVVLLTSPGYAYDMLIVTLLH